MIGATPTFYDPEQESQPHAQDYQHWIDDFSQTQLAYPNTSFPHQPPVSASRTQQQMQSQPRHTNHYQFVASQHQPPAPPPASSDPTQYGFVENIQDPAFNTGLPSIQRQTGVTSNWRQQTSAGFGQPPPSSGDAYYLMADQYPRVPDTRSGQQQQQYSSSAEHLTPGVALTPVSDATLGSRQSISPAWTDNQPLPPHSTGLPTTPTGSVNLQTSPKQGGKRAGKTKQRKRQKSVTDTDDDDDLVGANVANMPRPNRL